MRETVPAADLVLRDFHAAASGTLWVADTTYVDTAEGFVYLAVVLGVFSRKVAGWAMRRHLESELVTSALDMAICSSSHNVANRSENSFARPSARALTSWNLRASLRRLSTRPSRQRAGGTINPKAVV